MEFVLTRNNVCKGNIEGPDAKEDVDKVCFEVQKTSDRAGGKPTRDFSLQHKKFCSLNYAQDFGTTDSTTKESLKRTKNSKWVTLSCTLTKSQIVPCQILSRLCQQSQLFPPSVQTVTREDEGLDRELLTCYYQLSLSYSEYYSVIYRTLFTSARQSSLGVGPTKFRFKLT